MQTLPLAWRLQDQWVLLVGGGDAALHKARLLRRAGARLRLVATSVLPELGDLLQDGDDWRQRGFQPGDLDGVLLAVVADDDAVALQVSEVARAQAKPLNVVDRPALSTVLFPALIDRDPLVISISTGGASPVLARWLRSRIESWLPARWGDATALFAEYRERVASRWPLLSQRRDFWERQLEGPAMEAVLAGRTDDARDALDQALADTDDRRAGEIYLVGAGPGDPDLLTFKALRLLQKADVVVYDRLVSPGVLELARRDADRIYVGKKRSDHVVPQEQINALLVALAREGKKVCRLKGGDPFIFGRGGEELAEAAAANLPIQVVPGITAASGCAAYAGIPLTHRDHAQSVRFLTGHRKENGRLDLPWEQLTDARETLVFYMGLLSLPDICAALVEAGRSAETPAAVVAQGTLPNQKVVVGNLTTLTEQVVAAQVEAPSLLIIGSVVSLHGTLNWFGELPQG
ncbi:siroheme synthase CysG [Isoalcanivorax beigongshangi]|uniref:Siroheme synthase n=1 Tax=Isoalcanivorax beigongshangi TaxID=3238810 RepID=A0ABV4AGG3_9GAMM